MTNAETHVQIAVALKALAERRSAVSQEIRERMKRLSKIQNGIRDGLVKSGPELLKTELTIAPDDRILIGNPLRGL
ncbi:MAG: hypothetical protein JNJ82_15400 [Opitutaceae bacterium]|nr:hypothetical protein [Opitutaceae bacterium]